MRKSCSYNLLPNHYHLQVETQEIPISKIMHRINFLYAIYFRKKYKGSGHLFQERFFCNVVDKDSYFWELGGYINLNAVRAGLTKRPEDYKWSSYLSYYQKDCDENLIDREKFLEYIDEDFEKARRIYLEFIEKRLKENNKSKKLPSFIDKKMI